MSVHPKPLATYLGPLMRLSREEFAKEYGDRFLVVTSLVPPPVAGANKGCRFDPTAVSWPGMLILFVFGAGAGRRRCRRRVSTTAPRLWGSPKQR